MSVLRVAELIVLLAALFSAIAVLWHKSGLGKLKKRTGVFLDDWFGEEPRDGYEGRDSFPKRMAKVELRTAQLNHDMRDEVASRLSGLDEQIQTIFQRTEQLTRNGGSSLVDAAHKAAGMAEAVAESLARLEGELAKNREEIIANREAVDVQGERITDHRRRQDATIQAIRDFLENERAELTEAREGLTASVSELLMIDGHEMRDQDPG